MEFKQYHGWSLGVASLVVAGCGPSSETKTYPEQAPPAAVRDVKKGLVSNVDAGVPLPASVDSAKWTALAKSHVFAARPDPFALTTEEQKFDRSQFANRLFDTQRFGQEFDAIPEETKPEIAPEPQPYRRLAGIIVGDSILAIIEMGNGQPAQVVRPGQIIPGTEWRVVSIDPEKAVLRRGGDKIPHEVVVHLEGKPVSLDTPAPAVPQNPNGQLPGQGFNPGGFPGGRGRGGGRFGAGGGG